MFIIIYQISIQNRDNIISSLNKPPVIARKIRLKGKQTSFDESDDARLDKLIEYQFDFEVKRCINQSDLWDSTRLNNIIFIS